MAFFTSIVVPDIRTSDMDLPLWVSGLSNLVLQNRFGQVLFVQNLDKMVCTNIYHVSTSKFYVLLKCFIMNLD
jgi:hypothetical protein